MNASRHSVDMTSGNIWKQLAAFALPVLLGECFQLSYSMIDSVIVGRIVGEAALAAVGASETITKIIIGFFNGMSVGCTVIVAQAFGRKAAQELQDAVHTIVLFSLLLGLALGGIGIALAPLFVRLMNIPADTAPLTQVYLRIYFGGLFGLVIYNTITGILRAVGDSRRPLYFLIFSSVLNTAMDWLFVAVFHWGVHGAAYATVASQILSALLCLLLLTRTREPWRFTWCGRMDRTTLKDIFSTGFPIGLQKSVVSLSNVLVVSRISFFGTSCLSAWVVYTRVSHVFTMTAQSLASALTTFIGQNLGAKTYKRAGAGIRVAMGQCLAITAVLIVTLFLLRLPLIRLFGYGEDMGAYAELFLRLLLPFQVIHVFMSIYIAVLRGSGKALQGTLFIILGNVVFRQIYLYFITGIYNTPMSVGLAWPLGWLVSGLLVYGYYRTKMAEHVFKGI